MADHCANIDECLVVQRRVELLGRDVSAQRSSYLHGLDRATAGGAAAPVLDQFQQGDPEAFLDQAAALDIAGKLERQRALGTVHAIRRIFFTAQVDDVGHRRERDNVVDDCWLAEQAFDSRQWRLVTDDALLALQAFEHRRFFSANIRTCAEVQFDIEVRHFRRASRCRGREQSPS